MENREGQPEAQDGTSHISDTDLSEGDGTGAKQNDGMGGSQ